MFLEESTVTSIKDVDFGISQFRVLMGISCTVFMPDESSSDHSISLDHNGGSC